jgi:hypothetical protein
VDGRHKAGQDEIEGAASLPSSLRDFPRTALRFRGDDEFGCQQDLLTASFPLEDGEGELVDNLYINYYIDNIRNA